MLVSLMLTVLKRLRSVLLVLMCLLLLNSCSHDDQAAPSASSGPLRILSFDGELSAYGPRNVNHSWTETFSGVVVCAEAPVVVTAVDYAGPTDPLKAFATLHWIVGRNGKKTPSSMLSLRGSPTSHDPDWTSLGGRFERVSGSGVSVQPNCSSGRKIELLTTLVASKGGADVSSIVIAYTSNGANFSLKVPYRYVACGEDITEPERYCE